MKDSYGWGNTFLKNRCWQLLPTLCLLFFFSRANAQYPCAAGIDCLGLGILSSSPSNFTCPSGLYCDSTRNIAGFCPLKTYCPQPSVSMPCPSGFYCRTTSVQPKECSTLWLCPDGTGVPMVAVYILILVILLFLGSLSNLALSLYRRHQHKLLQRLSSGSSPASPSMTIEMSDLSNSSEVDAQFPMDIRFTNLSLDLRIEGTETAKRVLHGIDSYFPANTLNAVMGPSGAGKTSLVSALLGELRPAEGSVIQVNGRVIDISSSSILNEFGPLCAFVPQDDILHRSLTVEDILLHAARTRLPASWTSAQKRDLVEQVMVTLRLTHVRNSIIGDETERGISGGERKRVSIGMELVSRPSLLVLDEPTSGLDSTSSQEVVDALKRVSRKGTTVLCVLHQPRFEAFRLFDNLLLLKKGGHVMYNGPIADAVTRVESKIGHNCPALTNPADFLLDAAVGRYTPSSMDDENGDLKEEKKETQPRALSKLEEQKEMERLRAAIEAKKPASIAALIGLSIWQATLLEIRDLRDLVRDIALQVLPGLTMGGPNSGKESFLPTLPRQVALSCPLIIQHRCLTEPVSSLGGVIGTFFIHMVVSASSAISSTRTFGRHKHVFLREARHMRFRGVFAYFIGRCIYDIWSIARTAFLFMSIYYFFAPPPAAFGPLYLNIFVLIWSAYGLGYLCSAYFSMEKALVIGCVAGVAWSVTTGLSPSLNNVREWSAAQVVWWLSFHRWSAEAWMSQITSGFSSESTTAALASLYGYDTGAYALDIGMCFLIGCLYRIAALFVLYRVSQKNITGKY